MKSIYYWFSLYLSKNVLIVNYISLSYSLTGAQVFPSKDYYPFAAFDRRLSTQMLDNVFNDMMTLIRKAPREDTGLFGIILYWNRNWEEGQDWVM